jgi:asparagine synthase (glutamine-hydrolysing)
LDPSGRATDLDRLGAMNETLRHRGPDDAGVWRSADRTAALAQRRLAVIDLTPGGHQPMLEDEGGLAIVFNGEIYNFQDLRSELEAHGHRFRSTSDTEVLLKAYRQWGLDCVSHLEGMFAFAIYDAGERRVFLARDRAGEKPLFWWRDGERVMFVSELKALMAHPDFPRRLRAEALDFYLAYGYIPGCMCIFEGVEKLGQGQAMTVDLTDGSSKKWTYWSLPEFPEPHPPADEEDLLAELESLFRDSVRRRLIADVPVGILLSGGLDSSLVTAMAASVSSRPVSTFTVTFPGHGGFDEGPYAKRVAEHFGTEHTELVAQPGAMDLMPLLARQYDEPMADSSMLPTYLVCKLIREHATVALGGDGGDELFGGYPHVSWLQRQSRWRRWLPRPLRLAAASCARRLPLGTRGRNHLIGFGREEPWSVAHINVYFDSGTRRRLLAPLVNGGWRPEMPETYKANLCAPGGNSLRWSTSVDFQTYLVDDILVKIDRASMLSSLELRAPWLDHHLVTFAFSKVPDALRACDGERKILVQRLGKRLLPSDLDLRRKQGFSLPLSAWFRGRWGDYVREILSEVDPHLFDRRTIDELVRGQEKGYGNTQRLFALAMFELWRREYRVVV